MGLLTRYKHDHGYHKTKAAQYNRLSWIAWRQGKLAQASLYTTMQHYHERKAAQHKPFMLG